MKHALTPKQIERLGAADGEPVLRGYARVSSTDQDYQSQVEALRAAGCTEIYREKRSGVTTERRDELARALRDCRAGDVLVVVRLDRLARSVSDLLVILGGLEARGVGFRCLAQAIDTTTPVGRLTLVILGAVAEFENSIRAERQREGIARAKAAGKYKGRTPAATREDAERLWRAGVRGAALAKQLGCGVSTAYRLTAGMGCKEGGRHGRSEDAPRGVRG